MIPKNVTLVCTSDTDIHGYQSALFAIPQNQELRKYASNWRCSKMSPQKSSLLDKNMSGVTQYKSTHITPIGNGWYLSDNIVKPLLMTTLPGYACEVDLVQCGCRHSGQKCQTRKCECMKSRLRCTRACFCGTWCENLHNTCDSDSDWMMMNDAFC